MNDPEFKKQHDAASYNDRAETYNRYIQQLAGPLAQHLCGLARLKDGDYVLDVGCGTGLATRYAAQAVAPSGQVAGIDFSEGMLAAATRVDKPPGAAPLQYRLMDAESLDFPDTSFDAVISLCAVLHFPDIQAAIREMYRVLRRGGRLAVSFGMGRPPFAWTSASHYLKRTLQELRRPVKPLLKAPTPLMRLVSGSVPQYSEATLTGWSQHRPRARLVREMKAAGFVEIRERWIGHDVYFDSAEAFWEAQNAIVTEVRKRLIAAPPETRTAVRQTYLDTAREVLNRGGDLIYPYGAFYVGAVRPDEGDTTGRSRANV